MPASLRTVAGAATIVIRILLGVMFLAAGWSKLGQTMQTLGAVYSYQIVLPDWLAMGVAMALPWLEIFIGAAVLSGLWTPAVLTAVVLVLAGFTTLTAQAWWRGLPIDCGCFDFAAIHPALAALGTTGGATLRNIVLLLLACVLAWLWRQRQRAA